MTTLSLLQYRLARSIAHLGIKLIPDGRYKRELLETLNALTEKVRQEVYGQIEVKEEELEVKEEELTEIGPQVGLGTEYSDPKNARLLVNGWVTGDVYDQFRKEFEIKDVDLGPIIDLVPKQLLLNAEGEIDYLDQNLLQTADYIGRLDKQIKSNEIQLKYMEGVIRLQEDMLTEYSAKKEKAVKKKSKTKSKKVAKK